MDYKLQKIAPVGDRFMYMVVSLPDKVNQSGTDSGLTMTADTSLDKSRNEAAKRTFIQKRQVAGVKHKEFGKGEIRL